MRHSSVLATVRPGTPGLATRSCPHQKRRSSNPTPSSHRWQDSPLTGVRWKPQIQPNLGSVGARAAFSGGLVEDEATREDEILFSWSGTRHRHTDSPARSNTKVTWLSPHSLPWLAANPGLATGLKLFRFGDPLSEKAWKLWLENYYEYLLKLRELQ